MWKSPIEIAEEITKQINMDFENGIIKAVQKVGINVDKEELLKALQYDREQYEKGYQDGLNANKWILCSERLPEKLEAVNITWVNRKPEPYYAHIKDKPFVATGYYWNKKWWWYSNVCEEFLGEYGESGPDVMDADIEVIAWMPLPSAFAGE